MSTNTEVERALLPKVLDVDFSRSKKVVVRKPHCSLAGEKLIIAFASETSQTKCTKEIQYNFIQCSRNINILEEMREQ